MSVRVIWQYDSAGHKMLKIILPGVLLTCGLLKVGHSDDAFTGPGLWHVINAMKCEEDNVMPIKMDVTRRKMNRTHDGFTVKLKLDAVFDEKYAFRAEIYKCVTGGCKLYQIMAEDSLVKFVNKHAEENVKCFLGMMDGKNSTTFPISAGEHVVNNYVVDYNKLPGDGPYGVFKIKVVFLKDGVEKACIELHVEFVKKD